MKKSFLFGCVFYKRRGQISINTVLRMEQETEEGGWKNESQWSRFSGIKGEGSLFSAHTVSYERCEYHASMVENDAHCFCGETVSEMRHFSETADYANKEWFLINGINNSINNGIIKRKTSERWSHAKYSENVQIKSRTGRMNSWEVLSHKATVLIEIRGYYLNYLTCN